MRSLGRRGPAARRGRRCSGTRAPAARRRSSAASEVGRRRPCDDLLQHRPVERGAAAELGLARLDRVLHRQREDPLAVEPAAPTPRPTRRMAVSSSRRWRSTSSILPSSCSDMRLNSRPSCANSSLPVTGTGWSKRPLASRRAASRNSPICSSQRARDEHRARQREDEEGHQQADHEQAVLRDRVVQLRGVGEDHELLGAGRPARAGPGTRRPAASKSPEPFGAVRTPGSVVATARPPRSTSSSCRLRRCTVRASPAGVGDRDRQRPEAARRARP